MAARPKTLTAAIVPLFVSSALVRALGFSLDVGVIVCAGAASVMIQIATNLLNDAIDFKKGADTHERLGPVRVTQSGLMSPRAVMIAGLLCLFAALLFGIPLLLKGGIPILLIGLVSLFLAYSYTGGPFPLAYLGLGDLFVILFFGIIAVSGLVYLHTGQWLFEALVAGLQVGFLATVLIAVNNARDIAGDVKANKKTLAVRFGIRFVRWEITLLFIFAQALNLYWIVQFQWWTVALTLLASPLMLKTVKIIWRENPSPVYNSALVVAAKCQLIFGIILALAFELS
jgi:1,4-dihydroxy-2-naphthoate octaprenyltransferase